jgi:hypothetical protein
MHAKSWTIFDPLEQTTKFVEIQVEDNKLDSMDENNNVVKTTL